MKQFWKLLSVENSVILKGLKRPDTKSSKFAGLSRMFFALFTWATIGHCWADVLRLVDGLTEPSKYGCKFEWYFYLLRCNCSCLTFRIDCTCEKGRNFRDWIVIPSEGATGQASLYVYFQSYFENVHTVQLVTRF